MRAMPAGGKGMRDAGFGMRVDGDSVDLVLAETKRGLDRFDKARAVPFRNRDPVLDNLNAGTETFDFFVGIDANDFVVDPDAEITLLLNEIEEGTRLRFRRHRDPESDQHVLAGEFLENVIGD